MKLKITRKIKRNLIKKWRRNKKPFLLMLAIIAILSLVGYTNYMQSQRLTADKKSYSALLQLIAQAESRDNYNAYFGNAGNTDIKFTDMTIEQVLGWQTNYIAQGSPSSAIGKYQIINTTLTNLVREQGIDPERKFDEATQDKLAIALLEHRGSENYINNELSPKEFAANLAQEWAALPRVIGDDPASSYYADDGLNKSLVSVNEILGAIGQIRPKNI